MAPISVAASPTRPRDDNLTRGTDWSYRLYGSQVETPETENGHTAAIKIQTVARKLRGSFLSPLDLLSKFPFLFGVDYSGIFSQQPMWSVAILSAIFQAHGTIHAHRCT